MAQGTQFTRPVVEAYEPDTQLEQLEDPPREAYIPVRQLKQLETLGDPVPAAYVPAMHESQKDAPVTP